MVVRHGGSEGGGDVGSFGHCRILHVTWILCKKRRKKKNRMSLANLDEGEASGVGEMSQRSKERLQGT